MKFALMGMALLPVGALFLEITKIGCMGGKLRLQDVLGGLDAALI